MGECGTARYWGDEPATIASLTIKPFDRAIAARGDEAHTRAQAIRRNLVTQYGLPESALGTEGARIPHAFAIDDVKRQAYQVRDEALALSAVRSWRLGDHGVGDYLNSTCANVREYLETITECVPLLHNGMSLSLREDGDQTLLISEFGLGVTPHRVIAEAVLGKIAIEIERGVGGDPRGIPQAIHFVHPPPVYEGTYARTFGSRVEFRQGHDALVFDTRHLDTPFATADPTLHAILMRHATAALQTAIVRQPLLTYVRTAVQEELRRNGANQTEVARRCGMSPATLRRRLERQGIRYRDLVSEIQREQAAMHLTAPAVDLERLHRDLGFSHKAAFYRAFRRWYDCTPLEFRRASSTRD